MIDGRGRARITDFGLAAVVADGVSGFAGTPAYMSPEQLKGGAATARSDIYSLGLVLYEMFTGKRLFDGASLTDIQSQRSSGKTPTISSVVREIDPVVEQVVLRCLEEDPAARPSSAHAVIAALPGGDPLAAAVAAGETPSPAMVAAAGKVGDLQPVVAWSLMLAAIGGLLLLAVMAAHSMLYTSKILPKSTELLDARGAEIAERFGYTAPVVSTGHEWTLHRDYMSYIEKRTSGIHRWDAIARARPGVVAFTFRQSTRPMLPWHEDKTVRHFDPPLADPGMVRVVVDASGRLVTFEAVPPERDAAVARPADWSVGFREAALDLSQFHSVRPIWSAPVGHDEQRAWDGAIPQQPDIALHVEAAAHRGKLVWFRLYGPWDQPASVTEPPDSVSQRLADWAVSLLTLWVMPVALLVAVRNVRRGRGDRKGAFRIGIFILITSVAAWALRAELPSVSAYVNFVGLFLGRALYDAAYVWVLYVAIEPYVRRRWPHTLTSWSRLLSGRVRDPMVGRDVLFGILGGFVLVALLHLTRIAPPWFGIAPPEPLVTATSPFASPRHVVHFLLIMFGAYIGAALSIMVAMVIVRSIVKNAAAAAAILLMPLAAVFAGNANSTPGFQVAFCVLSASTVIFVMLRFGLLSLAVTAYISQTLTVLPLTLDTSAWYFGRSFIVMAFVASIVAYSFVISLGGKPLFGKPLLDDD